MIGEGLRRRSSKSTSLFPTGTLYLLLLFFMHSMASVVMARSCLRTCAGHRQLPFVAAFVVPFSTTTTTSSSSNNKKWRYDGKWSKQSLNPPPEKRPPRLFDRTKLRGSKKKSLLEQTGLYRADRVLANRTGDPRNQCFQLLKSKRVFQKCDDADGTFVAIPGPASKILLNADLYIDRKEQVPPAAPLLAIYHKPKWVLSVRNDPRGRPCIDQILATNKNSKKHQMHPVGRLDYDSSGLLPFSSSGALTQLLLHPKHEITKEYVAVVIGTVDMDRLKMQFQTGVNTGEGMKTGEVISVITQFPNKDESPFTTVAQYLQHVRKTLPSEYTKNKDWTNHEYHETEEIWKAESLSQVTVRVSEGKHRMVRRMLKNCGHAVVDLKRTKFGIIELGDLEVGSIRYLNETELAWAKKLLLEHLNSKQKEKADADDIDDEFDLDTTDGGEHFRSRRDDERDFNYDIDDMSVMEKQ